MFVVAVSRLARAFTRLRSEAARKDVGSAPAFAKASVHQGWTSMVAPLSGKVVVDAFQSIYARVIVSSARLLFMQLFAFMYWLRNTRRPPGYYEGSARRELARTMRRVNAETGPLLTGRGWCFQTQLAVMFRTLSKMLYERSTWYLHQMYPESYSPISVNTQTDDLRLSTQLCLQGIIKQCNEQISGVDMSSFKAFPQYVFEREYALRKLQHNKLARHHAEQLYRILSTDSFVNDSRSE